MQLNLRIQNEKRLTKKKTKKEQSSHSWAGRTSWFCRPHHAKLNGNKTMTFTFRHATSHSENTRNATQLASLQHTPPWPAPAALRHFYQLPFGEKSEQKMNASRKSDPSSSGNSNKSYVSILKTCKRNVGNFGILPGEKLWDVDEEVERSLRDDDE